MSASVFIVGADGFLGSRAVRAFLDAGYRVVTLGPAMPVDLLADLTGRVQRHTGSIEDGSAVTDLLKAAAPDLVVSFAAHGEGSHGLARSSELASDRALQVNVLGFRTLLESCRAAGVRRVLWSSSTTVFGPAALYPEAPLDEAAERRPLTVYGLTKLLAEQIGQFCRDRDGLEVVAVRMPLIFGPGRWYGGAAAALNQLIAAAPTRAPIAATVPVEPFDLMYADDVAEAFLALARHRAPLAACYHINGFTTSYSEIAATLAALRPGFEPVLTYEAGGTTYPLIAATRIRREIGFVARHDLAAGLRRCLGDMA